MNDLCMIENCGRTTCFTSMLCDACRSVYGSYPSHDSGIQAAALAVTLRRPDADGRELAPGDRVELVARPGRYATVAGFSGGSTADAVRVRLESAPERVWAGYAHYFRRVD